MKFGVYEKHLAIAALCKSGMIAETIRQVVKLLSVNKQFISRRLANYSKHSALVSPWRATELIGIQRVIKDEKGNKSYLSITFIQHSLKRHFPFSSSWLYPECSDCNILWRIHVSNRETDDVVDWPRERHLRSVYTWQTTHAICEWVRQKLVRELKVSLLKWMSPSVLWVLFCKKIYILVCTGAVWIIV